jgi:hypothetical protein
VSDDAPPPTVDLPDGWVERETTTEQVFAVSRVTVTATTVVYEDEAMRRDVDADVGDAFRRFVFASRLRLRPSTTPSKPLTKLVTSRAKAGFTDRLNERDIEHVDEQETRRLRIGGSDATLVRYDADCAVGGTRLAVDGWLAVWPDAGGDTAGDYLVAGGAYPTRVLDGGGTDEAALADAIEPGRFRDDLLAMLRSVR